MIWPTSNQVSTILFFSFTLNWLSLYNSSNLQKKRINLKKSLLVSPTDINHTSISPLYTLYPLYLPMKKTTLFPSIPCPLLYTVHKTHTFLSRLIYFISDSRLFGHPVILYTYTYIVYNYIFNKEIYTGVGFNLYTLSIEKPALVLSFKSQSRETLPTKSNELS